MDGGRRRSSSPRSSWGFWPRAAWAGLLSAAAVVFVALLGIFFMFLTSWVLSRSLLKGEATTFSLELPPYRPPRVLQTLYTSLVDRTLIVLWRAVVFALPAGGVIWLVANVHPGQESLAEAAFAPWTPWPSGGLNGVILLAYVVAIPANEIVIPTVLMLTDLVGHRGRGGGRRRHVPAELPLRPRANSCGWEAGRR